MRAITDSLKANFDRGWELLNQVVDACPDSVWTKKAGGYVFWQQIYHCFACADFFIGPKDGTPDMGPAGMEIAMLKVEPTEKMSKADVKAYGAKMKAKIDQWIASIDDATLTQPHEGLSARFGTPMNNVMVLAVMSGHSSYHVGHCDAILRDNGEKGVM